MLPVSGMRVTHPFGSAISQNAVLGPIPVPSSRHIVHRRPPARQAHERHVILPCRFEFRCKLPQQIWLQSVLIMPIIVAKLTRVTAFAHFARLDTAVSIITGRTDGE